MVNLDLEMDAALCRHAFEKIEGKARRADDRPAHKDGIGRFAVAEPADDRLRFQEIAVGPLRDVVHGFMLSLRAPREKPSFRDRPKDEARNPRTPASGIMDSELPRYAGAPEPPGWERRRLTDGRRRGRPGQSRSSRVGARASRLPRSRRRARSPGSR